MTNSRLITSPSKVEKENYTVILIDSTEQELTQLKKFLQVSITNFDVYLYEGNTGDLEWLNYISPNADLTLINDASHVNVTPTGIRYQNNLLEYFEKIEQSVVDNHN